MILNNLKNPLERKHLLSKLFLVISLSLISVFQTKAQYIIEIEIADERLQEIIKSENPNLEKIREIIEQKPWIVFAMDKDGNTLFTMLLGTDTSTLPLYYLTVEQMSKVKINTVSQLFTMLLGMDTSTLPLCYLTMEQMLRVKTKVLS